MGSGDGHMRTLHRLDLHRDSSGRISYCVGNSSVLFRALIDGTWRSLKCYNSSSPYRGQIYGNSLLEGELYVPISYSSGEWIDITISDWIEGRSLLEHITAATAANDRNLLETLSRNFDRLALDLLLSDCAHGDITCENIIVDEDLNLHLVDRDASFIPALAGMMSVELGTAAFQHPARSYSNFDSSIDDYSLCLISTALCALSIDPALIERYPHPDGLIFDPEQTTTHCSEALNETLELLSRHGKPFEDTIAKMLNSQSIALLELHQIMRYKVEGIHPENKPTITLYHNGLWGYLNDQNRQAIPAIFDQARDFHQGIAAIRLGSYWHYIDHRANVVVNCHNFKIIKSVRNGHGLALTDEGWVEIEVE